MGSAMFLAYEGSVLWVPFASRYSFFHREKENFCLFYVDRYSKQAIIQVVLSDGLSF